MTYPIHRRALTDEQEAVLAREYEAGAFADELAVSHGTTRKVVMNALRRQGVKMRSKREAQAHLNRRRRAKGQRHPNYKGARSINDKGYVRVSVERDDPMVEMVIKRSPFGGGWVYEHRLVMARHLGRPLKRHETVHHKNGKRDDNRLENLQLRTGKHGNGTAWECADCGSRHIIAVPLG